MACGASLGWRTQTSRRIIYLFELPDSAMGYAAGGCWRVLTLTSLALVRFFLRQSNDGSCQDDGLTGTVMEVGVPVYDSWCKFVY